MTTIVKTVTEVKRRSGNPGIDLVSWLLLLGAPASVVLALLVWHNVLAVFLVYHLGFCLAVPAVINLFGGGSGFSNHCRQLGLIDSGAKRTIAWGMAVGVVTAFALLLLYRLLGPVFLADNQVAPTLAQWGAGPDRKLLVATFLVLVNGPAEELFWRGYLQNRLAILPYRGRTRTLISGCYASYHGVTVFMFLSSPTLSLLVLVGIFGAGWFWAWLRDKSSSIWPSLLSHTAATVAYTLIWLSLPGI